MSCFQSGEPISFALIFSWRGLWDAQKNSGGTRWLAAGKDIDEFERGTYSQSRTFVQGWAHRRCPLTGSALLYSDTETSVSVVVGDMQVLLRMVASLGVENDKLS